MKLSRNALLDFLRVRYVADLYDEDIVDKLKTSYCGFELVTIFLTICLIF